MRLFVVSVCKKTYTPVGEISAISTSLVYICYHEIDFLDVLVLKYQVGVCACL